MPITTSAKKALRGSSKKRVFNTAKKELLNKTIKKLKKLVSEKKVKDAQAMLPEVYSIIDKSVKTGLLKKNNGSRKKERLVAMIKRG